MTLPLFAAIPALRDQVPHLSIAQLPTAVHSLPSLSAQAWVKRDDQTHPEYGGNKIRKLEFILAEAQMLGKDRIVTFGGLGTNHGVATAMLCQKIGLYCRVLLFDQPVSQAVIKNLQLMTAYGADLRYCGSLLQTVLRYYLNPARLSCGNYFLFAGGSNVAGTLAYVNAGLELASQIAEGKCPHFDKVFVAVGSSATLAGLTLGMALAKLDTQVVGVRVAPSHLGPFPACTVATVRTLMKSVIRFIKNAGGPDLALIPSTQNRPILLENYYGEGYGYPTSNGERARMVFSQQGIELEQTYTAKAAAAFLDSLAESKKPLLFWNTFNSQTPQVDLEGIQLDARLLSMLERKNFTLLQ